MECSDPWTLWLPQRNSKCSRRKIRLAIVKPEMLGETLFDGLRLKRTRETNGKLFSANQSANLYGQCSSRKIRTYCRNFQTWCWTEDRILIPLKSVRLVIAGNFCIRPILEKQKLEIWIFRTQMFYLRNDSKFLHYCFPRCFSLFPNRLCNKIEVGAKILIVWHSWWYTLKVNTN